MRTDDRDAPLLNDDAPLQDTILRIKRDDGGISDEQFGHNFMNGRQMNGDGAERFGRQVR